MATYHRRHSYVFLLLGAAAAVALDGLALRSQAPSFLWAPVLTLQVIVALIGGREFRVSAPLGSPQHRLFPRLAFLVTSAAGFLLASQFAAVHADTAAWLVPGDQPAPPPPAGCERRPGAGLAVYLGDSMAWAEGGSATVVSMAGRPLLTLHQSGSRLAVDATFFDGPDVVAQIRDNRLTFNRDDFFLDRPDSHTMVVYDRWKDPHLSVRYLNRAAVSITGQFDFPSRIKTIIDDHEYVTGLFHFSHRCVAPRTAQAMLDTP